jgi:hypothetical protein
MENPDGDSARQVARFRNQVDKCNADDDARLVVFSMGKDRFAYRSVTPDTVRAHALVGEHRLVQITVLGLNGKNAPDQAQDLMRKAVAKAEAGSSTSAAARVRTPARSAPSRTTSTPTTPSAGPESSRVSAAARPSATT